MKAQFGIMRFQKYKGPAISSIEAHNERKKEKYASNPDVDTSRSHLNFHLVTPNGRYRAEAERQIAEAKCRTRTDSVRLVETLFTGSPEFFKGKTDKQIRAYFEHVLAFLKKHIRPETIVSAVVHMDEKTPHMHVCFVPLTKDNRLCAKEIIGNKKRLIQWQDDFWKHIVQKYPELERGESASKTGRDHVPPRVLKEMVRLEKKRGKIEETLESVNLLNGKAKAQEVSEMLDGYIPGVEKMATQLKKYKGAFTDTKAENESLRAENEELKSQLDAEHRISIDEEIENLRIRDEHKKMKSVLDRIPKEILEQYIPSRNRTPRRDREGR